MEYKMKIGVILPHLKIFGGIRRHIEIGNRLALRGHEYTLYTPTGEKCEWISCKPKVKKIEDGYEDELDFLMFSLESQYKEPLNFKKVKKGIVYYILHAGFLYKYPEECLASYKMPYMLLANSNWTARTIKKECGKAPEVVFGGINQAMFHPCKVKKEYELLCYGDMKRKWKGTDTIEEAAKIAGLSLVKMVDIDPTQDKIAEEYSKAHIFVSGSWFEGWNNPGLEALTCGTPLVITNDGGSEDYVFNEQTALVVQSKDPQAMAAAITRLWNDKHLQEKLIQSGLTVSSIFTWENTAKNIESIFKRYLA